MFYTNSKLMYIKKKFHRAVSPTLCDSYSHTVLSRLTISGVSAEISSSDVGGGPINTRGGLFVAKCCIAIVDGGMVGL